MRSIVEGSADSLLAQAVDRWAVQRTVRFINCHHTVVLLLQRIETLEKLNYRIPDNLYRLKLRNKAGAACGLQSYFDQASSSSYLVPSLAEADEV